MPILATKGTSPELTRFFDCGQWDAMPAGKNGWTAVRVDCDGELPRSRRPWAEGIRYPPNSSGGSGGGLAGVTATAPLIATTTAGIANISYDALLLATDLLDALPGPYDSDEDAVTGGLAVGDWYLTGAAHVAAPGGMPKKVL